MTIQLKHTITRTRLSRESSPSLFSPTMKRRKSTEMTPLQVDSTGKVRSHTFPLNARRFLDDAVTRVFLKRSGGGYAFVHRRLLDYCADTAGKTAATEKKA